ncbi:amino acid permease [Corynebacterium confusum]|uniref:amino acid permease n=1 Tax=Corynebacterium confusum TaxID=71254 RepID=UPI0025B41DF3|nr:amino acid permease [Corynebacterium confusum]WJY89045.1 Serine transporter [Corynebacterium confusum]
MSTPIHGDELPEQHSPEHIAQSREEFDLEHIHEEDIQDPVEGEDSSAGSDLTWAITLFGTAVGAGILFLPINAGSFGFWPLLIATAFIGPVVFFSHRTYARIVAASPIKGLDVLQVITALTGRKRGLATALLYWLAIYPTVLIYGISITNTVDSFIVNQLGGPEINRWVLASVCIGVLTLAFAAGKKAVLWLGSALVYPLIIALAVVSFYLIPQWDLASFYSYQSDTPLWKSLLLILPVLVFSFSHMAALSQFALDAQQGHGDDVAGTERQVSRVELITACLLVAFTMFFVWSCSMAMGAEGMDAAGEANIPILSYFANVTHTPFMAFLAPVVAICAIASSFSGHMLGTEEGTKYIFRVLAPRTADKLTGKKLTYVIYVMVFIGSVAVAVYNPSILDFISVVGGIFVAFLVYIVPMLLFRKATAFKHYATRPDTIFVFIVGLVIMAVSAWGIVAGS